MTNPGGPATSVVTVTGTSVSVELAPLDEVVCTFTNDRSVTGAVLRKETLGGVGDFAFELAGPGGVPPLLALVSTSTPGVPETAFDLADVPPGTYTATEVLPPSSPAGTWEIAQAGCNGVPVDVVPTGPSRRSATISVAGGPLDCVVTNAFTPGGSITVTKTSLGGTGSFDVLVTPQGSDVVTYPGSVTTQTPGVPATATPDGTGTGPLAEGLVVDPATTYTVTELLPAPTDAGRWTLVSADCGPGSGPLVRETASVTVSLTLAAPDPVCSFVNRFVPWGTLDVVKSTTADVALRPDAAVVRLACGGVPSTPLKVPAGTDRAALPQQLVTVPTTCTVTEDDTGAAPDVTVATTVTVTVDGAAAAPLALGEPFDVAPAQAVVVTVTNTLTAPPPPPEPPPVAPGPGPTPGPADPGAPGGGGGYRHGTMPRTGADGVVPLTALAAGLVLAGACLLRGRRHGA